MKFGYLALAGAALLYAGAAQAQFVNGGFEQGNANGWTTGSVYRASIPNNQLDPTDFTPGNTRSSIITAGTVDPRVGALLGTTVYSGQYSYRVEDTVNGGNASLLQQRVNNYADANIFFAWKAVLLEAHGVNDAATFIIELKDLTLNTVLLSRIYNAAQGGGPFSQSANGYFYTANWQIESLALGASQGNDILLSIIAADCQPTGHEGYAYIDGFGNVTPPASGVPEPATWAMMMLGFGAMGGMLRRRRTTVRFNAVAA